jgi:hypothetical protein
MDILLSFEQCLGEEQTLEAVRRFLHRKEEFDTLCVLPPPFPSEKELRLLESIAFAVGVQAFYEACQGYIQYNEQRTIKRRAATELAEQAAFVLLNRSSQG